MVKLQDDAENILFTELPEIILHRMGHPILQSVAEMPEQHQAQEDHDGDDDVDPTGNGERRVLATSAGQNGESRDEEKQK